MTKETTRDPAQKLESKWQKILKEFGKNPRDVQTIPKINRPGRWFYVVALNGNLYVRHAVDPEHQERACKLKRQRHLLRSEFERVFNLYQRWSKGEKIWGRNMAHKAEEEAQTKMLIYWFGVFAAVWPSKHNFNGFKHQVGLERWQKIVEEFAANPHDVKTMPTNRRASKWFYVYVEKNSLYVDKSPNVPPDDSCKISQRRFLRPSELEDMWLFYQRRQDGENVFREATERCRNQVYWYGIFADLGW
ncbi:MAG: hypothetical protein HFJ96_03970 [Peptococcaceae bacterium]|jgi:hypothetical protein|nr:hypothetical protein [Peptococcaceae bacterium]